MKQCLILLLAVIRIAIANGNNSPCPLEEEILPCQCKSRGSQVLLSCRRSTLEEITLIMAVMSRRVLIIEELMLEENDIRELPANIFSTLAVRRLFLWGNGIERLAEGTLDGLSKNLNELHIREPRLKNFQNTILERLTSLQHLVIEHTPLVQLPRLNECRSLASVHIDSSSIVKLEKRAVHQLPLLVSFQLTNSQLESVDGESLHDLRRLQLLNLTGNSLTTLNKRWVVDAPDLKSIDLSRNKLHTVAPLLESLRSFPALQQLHLDFNEIEIIPSTGGLMLHSLNTLTLSHNHIQQMEKDFFHDLLSLRYLDLSYNNFRSYLGKDFVFSRGFESLEHLLLAGNDLVGNPLDVAHLTSALPRLKSLNLNNCAIESISANSFGVHPFLQHLSLRNNSIRRIEHGSFRQLPHLDFLDLAMNKLSSETLEPRHADHMASLGIFSNLAQLRSLDLSQNEISALDSQLFSSMTSLQYLNVSRNRLVKIDSALWSEIAYLDKLDMSYNSLSIIDRNMCHHLSRLQDLNLSFNTIKDIESRALQCKQLKQLDLSDNLISILPKDAFHSQCQINWLDFRRNKLQHLPDMLKCSGLRSISLIGNRIDVLQENDLENFEKLEYFDLSENLVNRLPNKYFHGAINLREINLRRNVLTSLPVNIFKDLKHLQKIDASRNQISELDGQILDPASNLRYLDLSHNNLTFLSSAGIDMKEVQVLDLQHNQINDLSNFFIRDLPSLSELYLSHNQITSLQSKSFESSKALILLDLSSNVIESIPSFTFRALPNLQVLDLGRNQIRRLDKNTFYQLIALEKLSLEENAIQFMDTEAFYGPTFVRTLNLSRNSIQRMEDVGLQQFLSLEILDLSNNQIRQVDSKSFRRLNRLVRLQLDNNQLCSVDEGSFRNQRQLQWLSLRDNQLQTINEPALQQSQLLYLDVGNNPLDCDCNLLWIWQLNQMRSNKSLDRISNSYLSKQGLFINNEHSGLEDVICNDPPELKGVLMQSLRPSRFVCDSTSAQQKNDKCAEPDAQTEAPKVDTNIAVKQDDFQDLTSQHTELPISIPSVSNDFIAGDTPTIYAGIRQSSNNGGDAAKEKLGVIELSSKPVVAINSLPNLKYGLNMLTSALAIGSIVNSVINQKNHDKSEDRVDGNNLKNNRLNSTVNKPSRGPDHSKIPWLFPTTKKHSPVTRRTTTVRSRFSTTRKPIIPPVIKNVTLTTTTTPTPSVVYSSIYEREDNDRIFIPISFHKEDRFSPIFNPSRPLPAEYESILLENNRAPPMRTMSPNQFIPVSEYHNYLTTSPSTTTVMSYSRDPIAVVTKEEQTIQVNCSIHCESHLQQFTTLFPFTNSPVQAAFLPITEPSPLFFTLENGDRELSTVSYKPSKESVYFNPNIKTYLPPPLATGTSLSVKPNLAADAKPELDLNVAVDLAAHLEDESKPKLESDSTPFSPNMENTAKPDLEVDARPDLGDGLKPNVEDDYDLFIRVSINDNISKSQTTEATKNNDNEDDQYDYDQLSSGVSMDDLFSIMRGRTADIDNDAAKGYNYHNKPTDTLYSVPKELAHSNKTTEQSPRFTGDLTWLLNGAKPAMNSTTGRMIENHIASTTTHLTKEIMEMHETNAKERPFGASTDVTKNRTGDVMVAVQENNGKDRATPSFACSLESPWRIIILSFAFVSLAFTGRSL